MIRIRKATEITKPAKFLCSGTMNQKRTAAQEIGKCLAERELKGKRRWGSDKIMGARLEGLCALITEAEQHLSSDITGQT